MPEDRPEFLVLLDTLLERLERGEDPEDFKESLAAKSKKGAGAGTSTPPNRIAAKNNTAHGRLSLNE